jgi:hypothetical protein
MSDKPTPTTDERNAAVSAITYALGTADGDTIRSLLCAAIGHPPVVTTFFGYAYCARCGAQVGDWLAGAWTGKGQMVVGHACAECDAVRDALRPEQRLLTNLEPVFDAHAEVRA